MVMLKIAVVLSACRGLHEDVAFMVDAIVEAVELRLLFALADLFVLFCCQRPVIDAEVLTDCMEGAGLRPLAMHKKIETIAPGWNAALPADPAAVLIIEIAETVATSTPGARLMLAGECFARDSQILQDLRPASGCCGFGCCETDRVIIGTGHAAASFELRPGSHLGFFMLPFNN